VEFSLSQSSYLAFSAFLHEKLGIVLGDNRQYLVKSRLSVIARSYAYENINIFLKDVIEIKDRTLTDKCLELMTTNETFWFRDNYPFNLLTTQILPKLDAIQSSLRIWSSACASGQEPYSIAMVIADYKKAHPSAFKNGVEIVATDFSSKMINAATAGIYDQLALGRGLDDHYKQAYFSSIVHDDYKDAMQINANIRRLVSFKRYNLLNEFTAMGKFDVIFCRNVLIYFDGNQKAEILKKFAACLPQSGVLMLGASESIAGVEKTFEMKSTSQGLYYSTM
jgi:chemotaxis protein methyltransferase CheR